MYPALAFPFACSIHPSIHPCNRSVHPSVAPTSVVCADTAYGETTYRLSTYSISCESTWEISTGNAVWAFANTAASVSATVSPAGSADASCTPKHNAPAGASATVVDSACAAQDGRARRLHQGVRGWATCRGPP